MKTVHALGIAALCAASLTSFSAVAQIAPDGVQRYFRAGERPIQNVKVSNRYADRDFNLKVKIEQELNKNTPDSKLINTSDFLMAPNQFALRAKENRLVRLVYTKPLDNTEKVYRIAFYPTPIEEKSNDTLDSIKMDVKLVQSTGMLVLVSPKNPAPKFKWERDEKGITIINEGNVSLDFMRMREYCEERQTAKDCPMITAGRVYPGRTRTFEFPGNLAIDKWYYRIYDQIQQPISIAPFINSSSIE